MDSWAIHYQTCSASCVNHLTMGGMFVGEAANGKFRRGGTVGKLMTRTIGSASGEALIGIQSPKVKRASV